MLLVDIFMALSRSIDLVDHDIGNHNKRVAYIAGRIAHSMGLSTGNITKIVIAGALHDIGVLKETEYRELVQFDYKGGIDYHSLMGYRLLYSCPLTQDLADIIKHHHVYYSEKKNIPESNVPLAAEIIHVADRLDVLLDYKKDVLGQKNKVLNTLREYSGDRFHPDVVTCLEEIAKQESFWFDLQFNSIEKIIKSYIFYNPLLTLEDVHEIAKLFTRIIDFRSRFTATHSTSVAMVARSLGQLCNLSERECLLLNIAGHLHDIGKLAIPLSILEKPDTLSTEEWRIMKRHTYFTYQILDEIDSAEFKVINEWAALHHEKLNGQGYPFKLSGKYITMGSRIMAIADTFTALAEMRPYRDGLTDDVIINILKKERGESLDTYIVDLLLKNYDRLKTVREQAFCDALKGFEDYFDSLQTA